MGAPPLRPALTLTEEELLVLTHGDLGVVPPRVQLPRDPQQADLVLSVALRSLMARGLVLPSELDDSSGDSGWVSTEPLGLTLLLRHTAPSVIALQRVLGPRAEEAADVGREPTVSVRYLHLHEEVGVLEDVTAAGMHSLLTVPAARCEEAVADFIVPPDAEPGTGPTRSLGAGREAVTELLAALGHPTVLVEVAIGHLGAGDPGQQEDELRTPTEGAGAWMLALGPHGTFCSRDSREYHPVGPAQAVTELLRWARPAGTKGSATMGP
jgi:hypothetical protein